ncbi:hypothetical protein ONZ45_g19150 [Pleurotus djamor]|nr:hypothetical protein ONZ45_g19150 [Pleurotus djamor]
MALNSLPPELCTMIVDTVNDLPSLRSLMLVSHQMRNYTEPTFCRSVNIRVSNCGPLSSCVDKNSLQAFHEYFVSPHRIHLLPQVKSLSVIFAGGMPTEGDLHALSALIPRLTQLRSLVIRLSSPGEIAGTFPVTIPTTASTPLSTSKIPFLPDSLKHLEIDDSLRVPYEDTSLPQLLALSGPMDLFLSNISCRRLSRLRLDVDEIPGSHFASMALESLVNLSCLVRHTPTLRRIIQVAKNLKSLEIRDWFEPIDLEELLCDTDVTYLRVAYQRGDDLSWLACVFSSSQLASLRCVEIQDSSQPLARRWYRGCKPLKVRWDCPKEDIWCHDWETDVEVVLA